MNQIEIRYRILEALYDYVLQNGISLFKPEPSIIEKLVPADIDFSNVFFNLDYLKAKGLIDGKWTKDGRILFIGITLDGIDYVEFYRLGISMTQSGKATDFESFIKKASSSGVRIIEESVIGLINIAISRIIL